SPGTRARHVGHVAGRCLLADPWQGGYQTGVQALLRAVLQAGLRRLGLWPPCRGPAANTLSGDSWDGSLELGIHEHTMTSQFMRTPYGCRWCWDWLDTTYSIIPDSWCFWPGSIWLTHWPDAGKAFRSWTWPFGLPSVLGRSGERPETLLLGRASRGIPA